ncbi:hypothetical protein MZM54_05210 [[Brevibacterium] frigoritolerans]|nr:hypothetical protein [Peribacillus frigoritolerans]
MKKFIFLSACSALLFAGCGVKNYEAHTEEGSSKLEETEESNTITLFRSSDDAAYVEPYEFNLEPSTDVSSVRQIFEEIETNVGLIDFRFENNDKKLVLNMDNGLDQVQGSAGERMFMGVIVHSFFENFPYLEEIYFEQEGQSPVELAHTEITEPFTREDTFTKKK